jgi:spermidine synthase
MASDNPMDLWVRETHRDIVGLSFKVKRTLFSRRSAYQQVDVVETCGHGNLLLIDGVVMLSELDEFVYHEMIAHVPLYVHPDPRRVLVVGGGDGGTVREVLRHEGVERVTMVEIDETVVEASRRFLPSVSCGLDDPRCDLRIEDGVRFVSRSRERFDVVIVDSTDPIGPAEPLFDASFYRNVKRLLAPQGILISQAESPFYDPDLQVSMFTHQRPLFDKLHLYLFTNVSYPGGLWSFGFASDHCHPVRDFNPDRVNTAGLAYRYYSPDIHRAAFTLPGFIQTNLAGLLDPVAL